jgi:single-stranded DNA-binding protein
MDSLNVVVLTGWLERAPALRWEDNGKALASATLRLEEQNAVGVVFRTYVALEAYGAMAERLGTYDAGDVLSLEGKLKWRSTTANGEKRGTLAVLVRQASVLHATAPAPMAPPQAPPLGWPGRGTTAPERGRA